MIKICHGSIFDSKMDALVNPVNCVGVMGKGLALEFKKRYPESYAHYKKSCNIGLLKPGIVIASWGNGESGRKCIFLFPTKKHWKDPSKMEYIESGLEYFVANIKTLKILGFNGVAFPMLGCGCGGLDKQEILSLMTDKLKDLDIDVEIYVN